LRAFREKAIAKFDITLMAIGQFAIRGNHDGIKRCLVCGIMWLEKGVVVSPRRCKSSINARFQAVGYTSGAVIHQSTGPSEKVVSQKWENHRAGGTAQQTYRLGRMCLSGGRSRTHREEF
jgi:hypothetical protein